MIRLETAGSWKSSSPPNHDKSKPVPAIIFFHGGSWNSGSLSGHRYDAHYLASRGMVAITSNYHLHTKEYKGDRDRYDLTNASARRALRWLKSNANTLGIDPNRIVGAGGSAGAQTVLGASRRTDLEDLPGDDLSVDLSLAAYALYNPATGKRTTEPWGKDFKATEFPPTIAFFGSTDSWRLGYLNLHKGLVKDGAPRMEVWWAPFEGHAFFSREAWRHLCLYEMDRFLVSIGLLEGEPTITLPKTGEYLVKDTEFKVPTFEVPEEIRSREIYLDGKFHTKGCGLLKIERAQVMTLGQALDSNRAPCIRCYPVDRDQCEEHQLSTRACRKCKNASVK